LFDRDSIQSTTVSLEDLILVNQSIKYQTLDVFYKFLITWDINGGIKLSR